MMSQQPIDPHDPQKPPVAESNTNTSGGINLDAQRDVNVGGDVVGRDKITNIVEGDQIAVEPGGVVVAKGGRLTNVHLPRGVQIAIGVAVLAIVVFVIRALTPASAKVNTEFVFDASAAMAQSERWTIAQTVFGDQATYATRREHLALRTIGGGCEVPNDPTVPLGADQADRLVNAVKSLKPEGDAALVDSLKAAADDLPADADAQNTIILVSAGEDTCLIKAQKDPCTAITAVADSLNRAGIKFTLHIVALRAGDKARQQLVCLARASANGYVYQANSVEDLRDVLQQVERGETPAQIPENWPISYTLELPRRAYGLDWSPDGKVVLVDTDREVWSWDLTSGQTVTIPVAGANAAWSPDGKQLAYFGGGGHIGIWNGDSTITLASDVPGKYSGAYSLSWSPDGQKIAAGSLDGTVPIWDIASQTSVRLSGHTGAVFNVAWSPDGKQVASAGSDKTVRLWDAATSQPLHVLEEDCCILGITWSPDSQYLAVAGDGDSTVRIWDVASGQLAARILSRYTGERTLRWSSDGAYLTRGSEILDMRRQQSLGRLGDPAALGWAWSPDSTRLAISSAVPQVDGNRYFVRVWAVPPATP